MPDKNTIDPSATDASGSPPDPPKLDESRTEPRVHVRWHVDAFIDGQGMHRGFIKDISVKGADIFLEHNMQNVKLIKLHIHVPPLNITEAHHVVEVSGKVIYSSHDSDELLFRTGIKFLEFHSESDRAYLQSRVVKH